MTTLADELRARIARDGPMRLDHWMAACNAAYYAGPDPLGRDFTTAPEISQMFGEIIGGWIGDLWLRAGTPPLRLIELGAGRGTLMADAMRVLARLPGFDAPLALIETSPSLRAIQAERLKGEWYNSLDEVPNDRCEIVIANEFFDALSVRQFDGNGNECAVDICGEGFQPVRIPVSGPLPWWFRFQGTFEWRESGEAIADAIAGRMLNYGGAALVIDYGYARGYGNDGGVPVDTLQALRNHAPADPFSDPGECDLTAHVDFWRLSEGANSSESRGSCVYTTPIVPMGVWLGRLGIEARASALANRNPASAAAINAALVRLTAPVQMGAQFKAMALVTPNWPWPAGFEE